MRTEYLLGGYLDGKEVYKSSNYGFDGKKLDLLMVGGVLSSHKDFEDLIQLLQIHKHCFDKKLPELK